MSLISPARNIERAVLRIYLSDSTDNYTDDYADNYTDDYTGSNRYYRYECYKDGIEKGVRPYRIDSNLGRLRNYRF